MGDELELGQVRSFEVLGAVEQVLVEQFVEVSTGISRMVRPWVAMVGVVNTLVREVMAFSKAEPNYLIYRLPGLPDMNEKLNQLWYQPDSNYLVKF